MSVPYAAWPKYGPSVLGQAEYDSQIAAWNAYQDSVKHRLPEGDEENSYRGDDLDTFTYTNKYVKTDQSRKRIFREQNIRAQSPEDAMKQGRDAMLAELGTIFDDENVRQYTVVPGNEKVAKPRGKAFEEGEDERRNEEGTNGHSGDGQQDGQDNGEAENEDDGMDDQQDEDQQGEGDGAEGEGKSGDDDTPKMPTCPKCQQPRGSTEGCCAPPESGDLPKPEQPSEAVPNLQLLRTDGEAPYQGDEANNKIQTVARVDTIDTIRKSLDDVDQWTRGVVEYHIHQLSTELYGQMTASHLSLKALIAKGGKGGGGDVTREQLSNLQRKMKAMLDSHEAKINVADIAEQVADMIQAPQRIEMVTRGGEIKELKGTPHKAFKEARKAMERGLNLFLVGPAGSGKGFLAQHLAESFGLRYGFVSCSEGMSEGMVLGRGVPLAEEFLYLQSSFVDFYENGGVFLLDEIDAANPNVLLIINECLSSPHLSIPNRTENPYAVRHEDFHVIVAANTWGTGPNMEYVGRNRLDAAFLNRFIGSTIELGYDARIEGEIAKMYLGKEGAAPVLKRFWNVRKKLEEMSIRRIWSTRGLEKMCIAIADGDDMATVLDAHTRGWTIDEKNKAGVAA